MTTKPSTLPPDLEFDLDMLEDYFDQLADADCEGDPLQYVPNIEMHHLERVRSIRRQIKKILGER